MERKELIKSLIEMLSDDSGTKKNLSNFKFLVEADGEDIHVEGEHISHFAVDCIVSELYKALADSMSEETVEDMLNESIKFAKFSYTMDKAMDKVIN